MNVLLAAHPTTGHTQALRAIGSELRRRGHTVHFAMSRVPRLPSFIETPQPLRAAQEVMRSLVDDGFELIFAPFSLRAMFAAAQVARSRGYDELGWATDLFTVDALACAKLLREQIRRRAVSVVVHDFTFFGAWLAAEAAKVPSAAVFHSGLPFPAPGRPPFGSGLGDNASASARAKAQARLDTIMAKIDRRLASARRSLGLGAMEAAMLTRPYSRGLNIVTSFESLELKRPDLAAQAAGSLLWAGPCAGGRIEPMSAFEPDAKPSALPSVYVSLGTVFNDQPRVFRALLDGVHLAGARAIVAAGASLEAIRDLAGPEDVIMRMAPQLAVLRQVDAVIAHGGNNTTNETLCAGKPLLIVPFGAEQIANGQRVEALGVGAMLRPEGLTALEVARRLETLLGDGMRARARHLGDGLPAEDGTATVASAIEKLGERPAATNADRPAIASARLEPR